MQHCLVAFLLSASSAFVAAQPLEISAAEAYSYSDTFGVPIMLKNVTKVGSATLSMVYDTAVLQSISVVAHPSIGGLFVYNATGNKVLIAWFSLNTLTQDTTFATLFFKKKKAFCTTDLVWSGNLFISDELGVGIPTIYKDGKAVFLKQEAPELIYPIPNSNNQVSVNTLFRWQKTGLSCVKNYRFQVSTNSSFASTIADTLLTDSAFIITKMQELQTHYWRVAKVDFGGNEYWSATDSFVAKIQDTIRVNIPNVVSSLDTVQVPVRLVNTENLDEFNLSILYDTTAFAYNGFSDLTNKIANIQVIDTVNGKIELRWKSPSYPLIVPSDTLLNISLIKRSKNTCAGLITWQTANAKSVFYFNKGIAVPAIFANGSIAFSDTISPSLVFPLDSSQYVFVRPTMQWQPIDCSSAYQLQISTDAAFFTFVTDTILADNSFFANLKALTTYYWKVGRYNASGDIYWSATWSFQTEPVLPIAVTMPIVVTEAATFSVPVVLDSLKNAIAFELYLKYDTTAVAFLNYTDVLPTVSTLSVQVANGVVKMSWQSLDSTLPNVASILHDTLIRLSFQHLAGCETTLEWNDTLSDFYHISTNINIDAFYTNSKVVFLQPEKPLLLSPIDKSIVIQHTELAWESLNCAQNYRLQVALDTQFVQLVVDSILLDTAVWIANGLPNTTYFWRVAKVDFLNSVFWSDTFSFTTGSAYQTHLVLDSVLTYQPVARVSIVVDSAFFLNGFDFQLQYNDTEIAFVGIANSLFGGVQATASNGVVALNWVDTVWHSLVSDTLLVLEFQNLNACKRPLTWLAQSLFFRDNAILQNVVITQNGSIEFLNTNAPTLQIPLDNQTNVNPLVGFAWQPVNCTVTYQLQVSKNNDFTVLLLDTLLTTTAFDTLLLNHQSGYFWRVGRWDSQGDRYWSDTAFFATALLPSIGVQAENVVTYLDTIEVAIVLDSVVWAQAFELGLQYDEAAFEFVEARKPLVPMSVSTQNGTVLLAWSDSLQWLTTERDTLVQLAFQIKPNSAFCETDLVWERIIFKYKDTQLNTTVTVENGSIKWVNDNAPLLSFPPNNAVSLPLAFELQWSSAQCATSYGIQIATDSLMNDIVLDVGNLTDTIYPINNLLEPLQKYYWRVRQQDSEGLEHWSQVWSFAIDLATDETHAIYPNPTTGKLQVWFKDIQNSEGIVRVYNSVGQLMTEELVPTVARGFELDLARLRKGIYFILFESPASKWVEKVLVVD